MYRKHLQTLGAWLAKRNRKPIILRGARQVGKSTLIRMFAEQVDRPLTEINLELYPELADTFGRKEPVSIINAIEAVPTALPVVADSLLMLDEIQSVPESIPALRYFYEVKPELPVLSAGSLLEFPLSDHEFSMPVGRIEYLHMGPMTFSEFLRALNEVKLCQVINEFEWGDVIDDLMHRRLLELMRLYCFIGGMPEAVQLYADTHQLSEVSKVHSSIIETYREDFPKYVGSRSLSRIQHVFNFAACNVGKKVKYSHFSSDDKSATIKQDIQLLCMARVLSKVVHSHCSGLPLQADLEEKSYKLLFLDVGLMNAICGLNWLTLEQASEQVLVNEGVIAEQYIGQHLLDLLSGSINRELTYWIRENRSTNAEVDYVIALNGRVVPIEVKAGAAGSLKSLHQFMFEKGQSLAVRFDTNRPSRQRISHPVRRGGREGQAEYELLSLPLYLVERLSGLVSPA